MGAGVRVPGLGDESAERAGPPLSDRSGPPAGRAGRARRRPGLHRSWADELALVRSGRRWVTLTVCLALALVYPFAVGSSLVRLAVLSLIAVTGAVALNLVSGQAGQLSLGHAAFLGVGAYSAVAVTQNLGWSFWWSLPVAAVTSGMLGFLLAPVALRLGGLYLAVVTIGLVYGVQHVFRVAASITGGVSGAAIEPPTVGGLDLVRGGELFGIEFDRGVGFFYLALAVAIVTIVAAQNLLRSAVGRDFAAIRDQDIAAGVVGVNPFRVKTQAFVVSSAMAGVAGALLAGYLRFVTFEQWNLHLSTEYLAMIVIGGLGSIRGAVLGAVFITALPDLVDHLSAVLGFLSSDGATGLTPERLTTLVYGLLLMLVMVVEPKGLEGLLQRAHAYWANWPFRSVR